MTKSELQQNLDSLGVGKHTYSLEGGVHDDKYVLSQEANRTWAVYYSERGLVIGKRVFDNENDACEYFIKKIISDQTIKRKETINSI